MVHPALTTGDVKSRAIGIDIDGTITAWPEHFAALSKTTRSGGGRVHVVSSRSPASREETTLELDEYGIDFDSLYLLPDFGSKSIAAPGELGWYDKYLWQKVGYAVRHQLTHFYDDDRRVLDLFRHYAPHVRLNTDWEGGIPH